MTPARHSRLTRRFECDLFPRPLFVDTPLIIIVVGIVFEEEARLLCDRIYPVFFQLSSVLDDEVGEFFDDGNDILWRVWSGWV